MTSRLFVYGTLAPGRPKDHVLAGVPGAWEPASITGTLVHRGWGAVLGFPGVVVDEHGTDRVDGFLFSSDRLGEHWPRLDEFEGDGYERVLTPVRVAEGRVEDAYVYVLRAAPDATDSPPPGGP